MTAVRVRSARTADVTAIKGLVDGYAGRVLLAKEIVTLYESVQEFLVGELDGEVVGCGALHVLWEDLGEIRTVAVDPRTVGRGVGHAIVAALIARARELDLSREAFAELRSSYDRGVAEFLDLPYVKPNTLGNTRMLKVL